MKIETKGVWKGSLAVEGREMDNSDGSCNFTYTTIKKEDETEIVLRVRPGETDMQLCVKAQLD